MDSIPVRAHGAIGAGHLILATGFLAGAAYYGDVVLGVIGLLNLGLAYSWSITPIFTVFHNRVESYNRLGAVRRRVFFVGLDLLEIRGRQIYLRDDRLPAADATLGRARDWRKVLSALDVARGRGAAP
jgi:hypothetical protein